jgi:hypothetical protein
MSSRQGDDEAVMVLQESYSCLTCEAPMALLSRCALQAVDGMLHHCQAQVLCAYSC